MLWGVLWAFGTNATSSDKFASCLGLANLDLGSFLSLQSSRSKALCRELAGVARRRRAAGPKMKKLLLTLQNTINIYNAIVEQSVYGKIFCALRAEE